MTQEVGAHPDTHHATSTIDVLMLQCSAKMMPFIVISCPHGYHPPASIGPRLLEVPPHACISIHPRSLNKSSKVYVTIQQLAMACKLAWPVSRDNSCRVWRLENYYYSAGQSAPDQCIARSSLWVRLSSTHFILSHCNANMYCLPPEIRTPL